MRIGSCRAENYLSIDIKYVIIREILRKLYIDENTCVSTHTDGEMAIYLLFILTIKDKRVVIIITIK